jgi:hypothetical protein
VNFGATPGTAFTVVSDSAVTCITPAGSAGAVIVTVVTQPGTALSPTRSPTRNPEVADAPDLCCSVGACPAHEGEHAAWQT